LRGEERERDESLGGEPVYFYLLKGKTGKRSRRESSPDGSNFLNLLPFFRITEDLPGIAQNLEIPSEKRCINLAYKVWEQAQAKLETDLKEY
jgi:hypothetical protein